MIEIVQVLKSELNIIIRKFFKVEVVREVDFTDHAAETGCGKLGRRLFATHDDIVFFEKLCRHLNEFPLSDIMRCKQYNQIMIKLQGRHGRRTMIPDGYLPVEYLRGNMLQRDAK